MLFILFIQKFCHLPEKPFRKIFRCNILFNLSKDIFTFNQPCEQYFLRHQNSIFFFILPVILYLPGSFNRFCKSCLYRHLSNQFPEIFKSDMIGFRHCFYVVIAFNLFFKLCQPSRRFFHKLRLSFWRIHIILLLQHFQTVHKYISRTCNPFFEFLCSQILNKFIRIFIRFHPYDLSSNPCIS